ncbi:MAG: c-type cytochrome [Parasphingorhabdus sp.]
MRNLLIYGLILATTACSGENGKSDAGQTQTSKNETITATAEDIALAQTLVPDDPALAAKYDRSCRTCHSLVDAKAPLTGHVPDWRVRLDGKASEIVLANIKNGLNAMPPMGLCNDCSDDELIALTDFMSGDSSQ